MFVKLDGLLFLLCGFVCNFVLCCVVFFIGMVLLDFVVFMFEYSEICVVNECCVQNYIKGVYVVVMLLLVEMVIGMVVGMNVCDDCLLLCKLLQVNFKCCVIGGLVVKVYLMVVQCYVMFSEIKGEVIVVVIVIDEVGIELIECEFVWVWVFKEKFQV